MARYQDGDLLGDHIGKVHQRRPVGEEFGMQLVLQVDVSTCVQGCQTRPATLDGSSSHGQVCP